MDKSTVPDGLMDDLINAIMDEINQKNLDSVEAYEFYANKLHLKLFQHPEKVCIRLIKGYQSLLKELSC